MKLIVNADDFGMSKGVNLGILECFKNGIVTSTSLMVNMEAFEDAINIMKNEKKLSVGIHFTLTTGKSITENKLIKNLVNNEGIFEYNLEKLKKVSKEEIEIELQGQFNKFLKTGFIPTHIDFHHALNFCENVLEVAIKIAKKYRLPMRAFEKNSIKKMNEKNIKHSENFIYQFNGENLTIEKFKNEISNMKSKKIVEIMTHPAYVDKYLLTKSSYNLQRVEELHILTSHELKEFLLENKIELISFNDLKFL